MKRSVQIASASLCASLYAVSNIAFATIPTPWGVGQFRPGVIIPAFFTVLFRPWVGAVGALLGTQLSSIFLPTGLGPIGSLVSGAPGNFFGFYLLGLLVRRRKDWNGFLQGSIAGLVVGNLIAASGVMFWLTVVSPRWASWTIETKLGVILGFTVFWFATMLPFVLVIVPILFKALLPVSKRLGIDSELVVPRDTLKSSSIVAVPILALFLVLFTNDTLSSLIFYAISSLYREAVIALIGVSGIIVLIYGFHFT